VSARLSRILSLCLIAGLTSFSSHTFGQNQEDPPFPPPPGGPGQQGGGGQDGSGEAGQPGERGEPGDSPTPPPLTYWKAILPGGEFLVLHEKLSGFGLQEYLVDGAVPVTEVSIAMEGSVVARFYYIEDVAERASQGPAGAAVELLEEKIQEAGDRANAPTVSKQPVVKAYPVATHAHTIEYRLSNKDSLQKLLDSLEESVTKGETRVFRP